MYNSNLSNVLKLLWETNVTYDFIQLHPVCPINGRTMNLQDSEAKFLVECQAVLSQSAAKWSSSEGFQDKSSPGSKVTMMIKSLGWDEVCCVSFQRDRGTKLQFVNDLLSNAQLHNGCFF